jgi:hypothetical protein
MKPVFRARKWRVDPTVSVQRKRLIWGSAFGWLEPMLSQRRHSAASIFPWRGLEFRCFERR